MKNLALQRSLLVMLSAATVAISTSGSAADAPAAPSIVPLDIFTVPEGLEVTLFARSPMLKNPTNMDFDAAGRLSGGGLGLPPARRQSGGRGG